MEILPKSEIIIFGSRTGSDYKPHSEVDIAILNENQRLEISDISQLQFEFSESNLPFRVDIVDYNSISEEFKKLIKSTGIKLS